MSSTSEAERPLVTEVLAALRGLSVEIDRLDALAAERFGVNRTDLRCVELLGGARALSPTALATSLGLTTGGMTAVIDRLERAGYTHRRPDPRDRRKLVVEATDLLVAREAEIFGELLRETRELIASYSDADMVTIRSFLERCGAVIEAQARAEQGGQWSRRTG